MKVSTHNFPIPGRVLWAISAWIFLCVPPSQANLVTNGSFETVDPIYTSSFQVPAGNTTALPGWTTTTGFLDCVVFPGTATTDACGNSAKLWPGSGFPATSPDGGNFYANDGDPVWAGTLSQTITGLTPGQTYELTFYQAAAQFQFFSGATTERWEVTLGSETHLSDLMSNASHDFVDWMSQSMLFTPNSATATLSFYAVGAPSGLPPVVLLDGVTLNETPEPGALALTMLGLAGIVYRCRRQRRV
ncbi:MAG: DUF642 domain-containing protein [Bryobacteraceae bacterium]